MYKLYVLLILSFSLTTCDKNQISEIKLEEEPEPLAYRLTQYNYYSENELIQSLSFSYEDESLVKWTIQDLNKDYTDSMVFSYQGNTAIGYDYYKGKNDDKLEVIIEIGLTKFHNSYQKQDDNWILSSRRTMQYSGERLIEVMGEFDLLYPSMSSMYKNEYVFNGDTLIEIISYHGSNENWQANEKFSYDFSKGEISEIIVYDYSNHKWKMKRKYSYLYLDGVLKSITDCEWDNYEGVWEIGEVMTLDYDMNGNISSIDYGDGVRQEYIYEEGKGNLSNFFVGIAYVEWGFDIFKSGNLNEKNDCLMERHLPFVITNPRHPFYIGNTLFYEH